MIVEIPSNHRFTGTNVSVLKECHSLACMCSGMLFIYLAVHVILKLLSLNFEVLHRVKPPALLTHHVHCICDLNSGRSCLPLAFLWSATKGGTRQLWETVPDLPAYPVSLASHKEERRGAVGWGSQFWSAHSLLFQVLCSGQVTLLFSSFYTCLLWRVSWNEGEWMNKSSSSYITGFKISLSQHSLRNIAEYL